ncbi:Hint domain-containing protein [Loktanella sp. SALINAS62]|uniref:Hint domain-containing protein n=1 Tax=Loktanella sp. SALINAS62 TaxID=2706124 RepID=UPI001B8ABA03|nr:Hint domain-containing protein [Loktanella sp. SALINAS62]MBS1303340.1 hypothetical protein [Loktanella sp. SALINAS62]
MFDFVWNSTPATAPWTQDFGHGLISGTKLATQIGWRTVDAIVPGDQCLTFDGGLQTVTSVECHAVQTGGAASDPTTWPLTVPAGALGNKEPLLLLPDQAVLVESDTAEAVFGDAFALIPAKALDGLRGIHRSPPPDTINVFFVRFAQDEIVFANFGALFQCPAQADLLADPVDPAYKILTLDQAKLLVQCLTQEDLGHADPRQAAQAFRIAA